jgi:hypothetical protein
VAATDALTSLLQDGGLWALGESLTADWAIAVLIGVAVTPIWAVAVCVVTWRLSRAERGISRGSARLVQ